VQKVRNGKSSLTNLQLASIENLRHQSGQRNAQANELEQLHAIQAAIRGEEEGLGCLVALEEGGSQAGQDD